MPFGSYTVSPEHMFVVLQRRGMRIVMPSVLRNYAPTASRFLTAPDLSKRLRKLTATSFINQGGVAIVAPTNVKLEKVQLRSFP